MAANRKRSSRNAERFRLLFFVLCDEARQEILQKLLLIGVYTNVVILPAEDVVLPRLSFVFAFERLTDEQPASCTFRLERSNGELVVPEATFPMQIADPDVTASNVVIQIGGVPLPPDKYSARLRVNGATSFAGQFAVTVNPRLLMPLVAQPAAG